MFFNLSSEDSKKPVAVTEPANVAAPDEANDKDNTLLPE